MKLRMIASLFTLLLVVALVIGGITTAWFTGKDSPPSAAAFLIGTVDIEITGEQAEPDVYHWEIITGEACRDFTWTIKNTGTKQAFLRARLEETLHTSDETAWAEGTRFFHNGSWAMYFLYDVGKHEEADPLTVRLLAGQHDQAGAVTVWEDDISGAAFLFVEYSVAAWEMSGVHLAVVHDLDHIPLAHGGPPVGRFPFKAKFDELKQTYTFAVPMQGSYPDGALKGRSYDWTTDDVTTLYIAAHADLIGMAREDAGMEWSQRDCDFYWEYNEADGYWYYCREPVAPGEEISLCLTGCPEDAGLYSVTLDAEAVQALPEAIEARWGGDVPCLQGP